MTMHGKKLASAQSIKRPVYIRAFAFAVAEQGLLSTCGRNVVPNRDVNGGYRRELPIDP
jgi:hypothetical protein